MTVSDERLDALSGRQLAGRYQLGELRATGAYCVVYDGQDAVLARPVAIKVAPIEGADAYREALNATAGLSYPAFLAIYDVIEQDERLYLVQEFIDGRPLSAYLADGAPARRSIALALQVARAIAYAHQHDVTHGDLTPAAILIDRSAVAHLNNLRLPPDWDYFTAVAASVALSGLAPSAEATVAALRDDERVRDVWSVGVALWSLITHATGEQEAAGAVAPRAYREDAAPEIQALLARALDVSHERRIISADELALALEALDEALAATPQRDTLPLAVRAYRESRTLGDAGMATGLRRLIERRDGHLPEAETYPGTTDPMALDTSATRPADDGLYAAAAPLLQYQPRPYQGPGRSVAPAPRGRGGERSGWVDAPPDVNPVWPVGYVAGGSAASVMRPWVWTLIGLALFLAFFLIGYLVFPQVKLF
ncbi:MAG TPA: protein kinase [Ktedonobacterales bacterium]